jgi:multiple sugar transport system substrate-binding protein
VNESKLCAAPRSLSRLVALLLILLLLLLSGCGDSEIYAPREPVTVQFMYPGAPDTYAQLVEAFESQHEMITIELTTGQFWNFDAIMENDVLIVNQSGLSQMIDEGYPVSLNAFISEDEDFEIDDFYASTIDAMSVQGQIWAIPYMVDMTVMVYNKDLFDKHNVPYPDVNWTWDSFLETAQRLTHEELGEYGYAYQQAGTNMGDSEAMLWIYQNGGRLFDDVSNPTRMTINDPLNVQALQFYADLIHRHQVAPRPGVRQTPYPTVGIEGGKYAMWIGPLSDDWDDLNVGIAPLPRGQVAVTLGSVMGLMISSEADDPRACWEWVAFVSENAPPRLMPARRSMAESDQVVQSLPSGAIEAARASLPNLLALNFNMQGQLGAHWGTAMQAYSSALTQIQNGDSVQAALDEAQTKADF